MSAGWQGNPAAAVVKQAEEFAEYLVPQRLGLGGETRCVLPDLLCQPASRHALDFPHVAGGFQPALYQRLVHFQVKLEAVDISSTAPWGSPKV